jgi:hypothetical protein
MPFDKGISLFYDIEMTFCDIPWLLFNSVRIFMQGDR